MSWCRSTVRSASPAGGGWCRSEDRRSLPPCPGAAPRFAVLHPPEAGGAGLKTGAPFLRSWCRSTVRSASPAGGGWCRSENRRSLPPCPGAAPRFAVLHPPEAGGAGLKTGAPFLRSWCRSTVRSASPAGGGGCRSEDRRYLPPCPGAAPRFVVLHPPEAGGAGLKTGAPFLRSWCRSTVRSASPAGGGWCRSEDRRSLPPCPGAAPRFVVLHPPEAGGAGLKTGAPFRRSWCRSTIRSASPAGGGWCRSEDRRSPLPAPRSPLPALYPESQVAMASISTRKPLPGRRWGWMVERAGWWPLNMRS